MDFLRAKQVYITHLSYEIKRWKMSCFDEQ